jgi:hypothetical protein
MTRKKMLVFWLQAKAEKEGARGNRHACHLSLLGIENWNKEARKFLLSPRSVLLGAVTEGKKS